MRNHNTGFEVAEKRKRKFVQLRNLDSTVLQDPQDEKKENYCPYKYPCTLELCPCIEIGVDKNKDETQIWKVAAHERNHRALNQH
jgi:hypothetical protein